MSRNYFSFLRYTAMVASAAGFATSPSTSPATSDTSEFTNGLDFLTAMQEYRQFIAKFREKTYSNERFAIFRENLVRIKKHNAGNGSFTIGINAFSDWTKDEKSALLGARGPRRNRLESSSFDSRRWAGKVNASVDWREHMPEVKNQKSCGSCWAFSALAVVDFFDPQRPHSEQQLLDCSEGSCDGYWPYEALKYLADHNGSVYESQYPYEGKEGLCRPVKPATRVFNVQIVTGAHKIMAALQDHVVSVSFVLSGNSPFFAYEGGVYNKPCGDGNGHAMAAVGYAKDYWIIRNSWGSSWGVEGHVYFKKGSDLCSIESWDPVIADATPAPPPPGNELRNPTSDKCAEAPLLPNGWDGARLILSNCTGSETQRWEFSNGTLQHPTSGKCAEFSNSSVTYNSRNSAPLKLQNCTGSSSQQWTFGPHSELMNPFSGKCMAISTTGIPRFPDAGTPLTLSECTGGANEQWSNASMSNDISKPAAYGVLVV